MRKDIDITPDDVTDEFEPYVFDKDDPYTKALMAAGISEETLKRLSADYAEAGEEIGEDVPSPADMLVEKRGR